MDYLLHALDSARYRKDSPGAASPSDSLSVRPATCKTPESGSEVADAIIISDLHLGSENSQARLITQFLESLIDQTLRTRRLIINGDVFDSIDFRRLKKTHWKVLSTLRHLSDKV